MSLALFADLRLACCIVALAASGCLEANLVQCANGLACPVGTVCDDVHASCATPEQLAVCEGLDEGADCVAEGVDGGCFDGVCLRRGCANGIVEKGEQCDDRNERSGDGCSGDCRSDETCGNGIVDPDEQCDDAGLLSRDGCDSRCIGELPSWREVPISLQVAQAMVAYDEARQVLVAPDETSTWELAGDDVWRVAPAAPGAGFAPYFDPVRGKVVAFIADGPNIRASTWDGTSWTAISAVHDDVARVATFDTVRSQPIVFMNNGVWTFGNNGAWSEYLPSLVATVVACAYDPANGEIVAFDLDGSEHYYSPAKGGSWDAKAPPFSIVGAVGLDGQTLVVVSGMQLYRRSAAGVWTTSVFENLPLALYGTSPGIIYNRAGTLIVERGVDRCRRNLGGWACTSSPGNFSALDRDVGFAQDGNHDVRLISRSSSWKLSIDGLGPREPLPAMPADFVATNVTYSAGRRTIVAVGNIPPCSVCSTETYVLGASGWTRIATDSRSLGPTVYDPDARGVVRLVYGAQPFTILPDDASTWASATAPEPLTGFEYLVWDTRLHRMVGVSVAPFVTVVHDLTPTGWDTDDLAPLGVVVADERAGSIVNVPSTLLVTTNNAGRVWERRAGMWRPRLALPFEPDVIGSAYESDAGRLWVEARTDYRLFAFVHEWSSPTPLETCTNTEDLDGDGLAGCADPDCYWACTGCPPFATCRFDLMP